MTDENHRSRRQAGNGTVRRIVFSPIPKPATVRSPDAVHLATALWIRTRLTSFVTYDKRLADAARTAGPTVGAPA